MGDAVLPGAELVERGLADLRAREVTAEALLLWRFPHRLAGVGIDLPGPGLSEPESRLYALLAEREGDGAHSAYNALTRRLVSYLRAAERAGSG